MGAALPENMDEKQVNMRWFKSELDVATLEPKFYPFLRDKNAKGLATLIQSSANTYPHNYVVFGENPKHFRELTKF